MSNYYISFYLKAYRIHIFVDALRAIGSPKRICFLIDNGMKHLAVIPYSTRDFKSHGVPDDVYNGSTGLEISSFSLEPACCFYINTATFCEYIASRNSGKIYLQ